MPDYTTFSTKYNNYLFSFNKKYSIYFHHLMRSLINHLERKKQKNGDQLVDEKESDNLVSQNKNDKLEYYKRKYEFLRENGFFENIDNEQIIGGRLKESDIEYELSNLRAIVFEITERCNLQCKYCFYGDSYNTHDSRVNLDLNILDARAIVDYLIPKWLSKLNTNPEKEIFIGFFGGEPLLNFSFIETFVLYINQVSKNTGLTFRFNMTTNGVLLNKYIDFISNNNFALTISLDGEAFANSYRLFPNGKESFDLVYNNIHLVKQKYPDFFERNVLFNAVLHDRNDYISTQQFAWREFNLN